MPLVLTPGRPGSFVEMEAIIPLLADPGSHGGDPLDAFDVAVPSLPGFGFSQALAHEGIGPRAVADLWATLMARLGYTRYGLQGGDLGAGVSTWLARHYPEHVTGLHLNYISPSYRPPLGDSAALSGEERSGRRLLSHSAHQAANARVRAQRFTAGPGGMDRRKIPVVDRLRRRPGKRHRLRHAVDRYRHLLVHRHHRLVVSHVRRTQPPAAPVCRG